MDKSEVSMEYTCNSYTEMFTLQTEVDKHSEMLTMHLSHDKVISMEETKIKNKDNYESDPKHRSSPCPMTVPIQDVDKKCLTRELTHVISTTPDFEKNMGYDYIQQTKHNTVTHTEVDDSDTISDENTETSRKDTCSSPRGGSTKSDLEKNMYCDVQQTKLVNAKDISMDESPIMNNDNVESTSKNTSSPCLESVHIQDLHNDMESPTRQVHHDSDTNMAVNESNAMNTVESPKYQCTFCSNTFAEQGELEVHADKDTDVNVTENRTDCSNVTTQYTCSSCSVTCLTQSDLDKHQSSHTLHSEVKIWKVALVDVWKTHPLIMSQVTLPKIIKEDLNVDEYSSPNTYECSWEYSCPPCMATFPTQEDLDYHMGTSWHSLQLTYMQSAHVRMHKIKIYKCDFCTRASTDERTIKEHHKTYFRIDVPARQDNSNHSYKPFQCKECGWGFMQESTLETHSILHKPFPNVCECGIGYYQKIDLDMHRRLLNHYPKIKKEPEPNYTPKESKFRRTEGIQSTSKIGPRLKASLTFKQSKDKSNKSPRKRNSATPKGIALMKSDDVNFNSENIMFVMNEESERDCSICQKTFSSITTYKTHMIKYHGWTFDIYKHCKICGKEFNCARRLNDHMAAHMGIKPYKCQICNKGYSQEGALNLHKLRHTGERNFPCETCGKSFYNGASLRLHQRVHTGEKPYECKVCSKSFADPSAYKRHKLIHTGVKSHKCKVCEKAYCDPAALHRHIKTIHNGYSVPCDVCHRTFKSKAAARAHMLFQHDNATERDYSECDYCGKKFAMKGNLITHVRFMHMKIDATTQCDICNKRYSKSSMSDHIRRVHLKAFDHKCGECGRRFLHRHQLRKHGELHRPLVSRDRLHECDYCHKSYYDKEAVGKHIVRVHLGIECGSCSRTFSTSILLKKHKCKRCKVCKKTFISPEALKRHYIKRHVRKCDQERHECSYCSKLFLFKDRMFAHIRHVHTVESFQCDHCGDTFPTRHKIVYHIRQEHTMLTLYCDCCMKKFYSESDFRKHKLSNCRPREIPCEICEKTFPSTSGLRNHLSSHGPDRYECDTCGRMFKHRGSILRHLVLVHALKVKLKNKRLINALKVKIKNKRLNNRVKLKNTSSVD